MARRRRLRSASVAAEALYGVAESSTAGKQRQYSFFTRFIKNDKKAKTEGKRS
jgi:hypothetical protein